MSRNVNTRWSMVGGAVLVAAMLWAARSGHAIQSASRVWVERLGGKTVYTNRLIYEKSPYLQLHAHNPVDWFPWGEEAFEKARREGKPIFLSIGYSTCHWCHVMERESFSDPAIAEIMNKSFVAIKVDREEREDIDRVYMAFVQATTGGGGWPMSVFLTPDRQPFLGGTYFPPDDRGGRPGFRTVLLRVGEAWTKDRDRILQSAQQATEFLQAQVNAGVAERVNLQTPILDQTYQLFKASYDADHGGFGAAPKFPQPVIFNFLLRYYARTGQRDALSMTLHTLRAMALGGVHDHLAGGFHRYSTDATWHVPHFEKMLYDQAQLAVSYAEAYQITKDRFFADATRDILDYVLRDMRGSEGGFYSAEDADSATEAGRLEQAEGAFYVWTAHQIRDVLGEEAAAVFDFYYGVTPSGNVPAAQDVQGELKEKNVLIVRHSLDETARAFKKPLGEVQTLLADARSRLAKARSRRPRPPRDDKVLTAWNGLMISALARAAQTLDDTRYLGAATRAAEFMRSRMYDEKTHTLRRRYREGHVGVDAFLSDYACLIQGLLDLYEASFDVKWLAWAMDLQATQDKRFGDAGHGGYFAMAGDDRSILARMKVDYDGAEPAPASVAAMNLLRLSQITDRQELRQRAEATFATFGARLKLDPAAVPQLVAALDFSLSKPKQIIIAGRPGAPDTRAMLRLVYDRYIPNKIVLLADGGAAQRRLAGWLPVVANLSPKNDRATAYICEDYVCQLPTSDLAVAARLLDGTRTLDGRGPS